MAEHAALKEGIRASVAIFSLEMPADQILTRMLSSVGSVHLGNIRSGKLSEDDWPRITGATKQLQDAKIFIDDTPALTPTELRARARRIKREHGLDLIVVDYLQLMSVPGTKENRATEISEISRGLKALAKEIHCPVIALSQLNRGVEQRENKRPVMSDLRESGAIEQDADMILLIYRDEVYNKETPKKGVADIDLAKHRNGETGDIRLTFRGQNAPLRKLRGSGIRRRNHALIRLIRALIDTAALRHNLGTIRAYAPRREGHGRHQGQCLRPRARLDGARRWPTPTASPWRGSKRAWRCAPPACARPSCCSKACSAPSNWPKPRIMASSSSSTIRCSSSCSRRIAARERFVVWIKIDTGMNRLGFRPEAFPGALARLRALTVPALELRVMTHLARADERNEPMTREQVDAVRRRRSRQPMSRPGRSASPPASAIPRARSAGPMRTATGCGRASRCTASRRSRTKPRTSTDSSP